MSIRLAINGYGRIGRNILRAIYEANKQQFMKIVAINDLGNIDSFAHLTKYDSTHGRFFKDVELVNNELIINGDIIKLYAEQTPSNLPWKELDIDIVLECTGVFATRAKASAHLIAGAKKVLISAPAGGDVDATIVYGVNHGNLKAEHKIVSNASCTTNCLVPLAQAINNAFSIESGLMTTVHSYTNDQVLTDVQHTDLRRARSATQSLIPTKTGAAAAIGLVMPELSGKLDGLAVRVPTINVSLVDLTVTIAKQVTVADINNAIINASQGALAGILIINNKPLVSIDFNHNPASCIVDITQTRVVGKLVKVLAWYDNEWGFSNRMLDTANAMMAAVE